MRKYLRVRMKRIPGEPEGHGAGDRLTLHVEGLGRAMDAVVADAHGLAADREAVLKMEEELEALVKQAGEMARTGARKRAR